jgi:AAA ATPase domain/AAA domain, putative AbiEii toxin, Type IV TA system
MKTLKIRNLGQIKKANLEFGDLTVLVGPQASGKSIALQLLKLILDAGQVQSEMGKYGLDWDRSLPQFFDAYFGEGMNGIWRDGETSVKWKGKSVDLVQIARHRRSQKEETLFFIPAQRVLAMRDGWPRPFTDYAPGDPFAVREFSEKLRVLVEQELGSNGNLFPQERRLKKEFRNLLERNVFGNFRLKVDKVRSQKRLVLGPDQTKESLPYMVWSAGQREFVPLLLGLYWLMPRSAIKRRDAIEWVVLEELEMGLHPRAIGVVLLLVLELLKRGYRVCLSTHSPQVLDAIWALNHLKANGAKANAVLDMFAARRTQSMRKLADAVLKKDLRVFYFDGNGKSVDISKLDPSAEEDGESGWGGLSEFSARANKAVTRSASKSHSGSSK